MALYLGSSGNLKIILNGIVYSVELIPIAPVLNNIALLSSDNYILKDLNGVCLTAKESD